VQFVGQCQGLIADIPSVDELVQRFIREAEEEHQRIGKKFVDISP
jgi:hypothetical protein